MTDISRSIIDREKLKIKKRKISEKQKISKKGYDQAVNPHKYCSSMPRLRCFFLIGE